MINQFSLIITGSHDSGNSVVSPMGTVYGKPITLDPCIFETAEGNLTKFGTSDYVPPKFMCANFQKNWVVGFPRRIRNMFILR